ncbi:MAG TPA: MBL fold metallo-hydrolase [Verrucomicrobiae bacterium]|jgi:ribonuclease Z
MAALNLKCFGVGDGSANAERNHSAFFYQFANAAFLIDCGEPLSKSYKASGLSYEAFDHIFITHLHSDHAAGFFMFLQSLWLEKRKRPLTVYMPASAIGPVRQMLETAYLFEEVLPFPLRLEPLQNGRAIEFGEMRVTPYLTTHLANFRRKFEAKHAVGFEAFCFLMESAGCRIGHSGDLGSPADLQPLLSDSLDLLVCELAHFSPESLFSSLGGKGLKQLALVHLDAKNWNAQAKVLELAAKQLPGVAVSIPHDQDAIALRVK